jgi:hypothetical protein
LIIGLIYGVLVIATDKSQLAGLSGPILILGVLAIGAVVMSLGMTATFISVHDRHAEIVDELRAVRTQLERRT